MIIKKVAAAFLLLTFLLQTFGQLVVLTSFYLQRNFIAKVFCENKVRPQLTCEGKCYLKKQLKKQQQQERQMPAQVSKLKVNLFVTTIAITFQGIPFDTNLYSFISSTEDVLAGAGTDVFRPPIRAAFCSQ